MKTSCLIFSSICLASSTVSQAATVYAIDFDSTRLSGSNTSGAIDTETGFTSLDTTNGGSATVTVDSIAFTLFTTNVNASRVRSGPNALTRDFIFEEGGPNNAVGILIGGAGDLAAGDWRVEVWGWDSGINTSDLDSMIVGSRRGGAETIHTTDWAGSPTDPFVFTLNSDGVGAYDVFVRENNATNRARMSAIRLTQIPEPGSSSLVLGSLAFLGLRRRRSVR